MSRLRAAGIVGALLATAALVGCGHGFYYAAGVSVGPPPPPLVYGPVGGAPGPGYVWLDGHYAWDGGQWGWRPGYWARPPHPHDRWVKPRWDRERHGYRFHEGHWERRH